MQQIYPLKIELLKDTHELVLNCFNLKNEKIKLIYPNYFCSLKLVSSNDYSKEYIDNFFNDIDNIHYFYHVKGDGYNLINPKIKNGVVEKDIIYKIYLKDDLKVTKKFIKKIERNLNFKVVEFQLTYEVLKFQKDINIFLFEWSNLEIFENIIIESHGKNTEIFEPPKFKKCCYDIETWYNPDHQIFYNNKDKNDAIGSICLKVDNQKPIILLVNKIEENEKDFTNFIRITFGTELKMLRHFINNYWNNCDVVYGHNSYVYDDVCIKNRYELLEGETLKVNEDVIRYDTMAYSEMTFKKYKSHSLKSLLEINFNDYNKLDLSYSKMNKIFNEYEKNQDLKLLEELILYNIRDVEGTYRLEEKMKGLKALLALSSITSFAINDMIIRYSFKSEFNTSKAVLNYIYKISKGGLYIYNTTPVTESYESSHNQLTTDKKGLYENVYPFDFASLYPSMIRFYNISPDAENFNPEENKNCNCFEFEDKRKNDEKRKKGESKKDEYIHVGNVKYYFFKPEYYKSFFREMMDTLGSERNKYKKLKKQNEGTESENLYDSLQLAFKLLMNSTYGKFGDSKIKPNNTFHISNRPVVTSITFKGRENIKILKNLLSGVIPNNKLSINYDKKNEKFYKIQNYLKNSKLVYIDTDSVYQAINKNQKEFYDIGEIEEYLSCLFIKPIIAEAENVITFLNIVKKKNYIYQLEKDKSFHTLGWKKGTSQFISDFHNNVFKNYAKNSNEFKLQNITFKDYVNKKKDEEILKMKNDFKNINNGDFKQLNKYTSYKKINKGDIDVDDKDKGKIYKKCISNSKKLTDLENAEITNKNIKDLMRIMNMTIEELDLLSSAKQSPLRIRLYKKLNVEVPDFDYFIQCSNFYNHMILNSTNYNCLSLQLINNRPFKINTKYYTNQLKKYINDSIIFK